MPDTRRRMTFGLALLAFVGLSHACEWRDPFSGRRTCRAAPAVVKSWSAMHGSRRPGDHAGLEAWATSHPSAVNAQYGGLCETPLHTAARFGREDIAAILLAHGADSSASDASGNPPVTTAAAYGQVDVMKVLLVRGADVNRRGRNGRSPLVAAVTGVGVETDLEQRLEVAR